MLTAGTRCKVQGTRRTLAGVCILYLVFCASFALPARAVSLDEHPVLQLLMEEMASKHGFARKELEDWLSQAEIREDIIEAVYRPKENLPWYEYRKLFVNDDRARRGLAFWKTNAEALFRAGSEYGVPPEIIVAIIGVETFYGRQGGAYRVLDALVTLTLRYPERSDFFRNQLVEFLLLARELGVSPLSVKGSYAGAMGIPQFIPSSYRNYAVDFDSDCKRDLTDIEDAVGSVANFLKQHGWKRDESIVGEVKLDGSMYAWLENNGPEPRISIQHLSRYGILPVQRIDARQLAALIAFEGETAPIHRLGYNNFYVITRYNRSKNYSMAVVELSEMLHKLYYGG
jgi:membrane-bound lytic murein transglycosylase B